MLEVVCRVVFEVSEGFGMRHLLLSLVRNTRVPGRGYWVDRLLEELVELSKGYLRGGFAGDSQGIGGMLG